MHFRNLLIGLLAMAACCTATYSQTITAGGIVNAAGYRAPVAPGSVISVFGSQLASTAVAASTVPLPTTLGGVSVLVNGSLKAPLFYVSATQINAQLPYETPPGTATLAVGGSAAVYPSPSPRARPGSLCTAPTARLRSIRTIPSTVRT